MRPRKSTVLEYLLEEELPNRFFEPWRQQLGLGLRTMSIRSMNSKVQRKVHVVPVGTFLSWRMFFLKHVYIVFFVALSLL